MVNNSGVLSNWGIVYNLGGSSSWGMVNDSQEFYQLSSLGWYLNSLGFSLSLGIVNNLRVSLSTRMVNKLGVSLSWGINHEFGGFIKLGMVNTKQLTVSLLSIVSTADKKLQGTG